MLHVKPAQNARSLDKLRCLVYKAQTEVRSLDAPRVTAPTALLPTVLKRAVPADLCLKYYRKHNETKEGIEVETSFP